VPGLVSTHSACLLNVFPCLTSLELTNQLASTSIPWSVTPSRPTPHQRQVSYRYPILICQTWADAASFTPDLLCLGRLSKNTAQVVTSQITGYAFRPICFATSVTSQDLSNPPETLAEWLALAQSFQGGRRDSLLCPVDHCIAGIAAQAAVCRLL
jgi:hypothetical protein